MLNGRPRVLLHGVDITALVNRAVNDSKLSLSWWKREELVAYLEAQSWEFGDHRYDPDRHGSFSTACYRASRRWWITNWVRKQEGRTVQTRDGKRVEQAPRYTLHLDAEPENRNPEDPRNTRLGQDEYETLDDPSMACDPGFRRALLRGSGRTVPGRGTRSGANGAGWVDER